MFELFKKGNDMISREEIAELLKVSPEALSAFEKAYKESTSSRENKLPQNLFSINAKMAGWEVRKKEVSFSEEELTLIDRIVAELLEQTEVLHIKGGEIEVERFETFAKNLPPIAKEDVAFIPESERPKLTGMLSIRDMGDEPSYPALLSTYKRFIEEKNPEKKKAAYDIFRQGLDILDLDDIVYEIIGTNPNSMGNWLPTLASAASKEGFFKVPETKVVKVPMSLLQLTRLDYFDMNPMTMEIVNRYCSKAFSLDESKDYFIKTGTYSSKFDFRNAHVESGSEVSEIGSYLLFIHWQALQYAHYDLSGRNQPVIYGMSTTNEWVVREFIPDKEGNLSIYHGLPLRTEYRAFVDFDTKEVLGIHQYWDSAVMKRKFSTHPGRANPEEMANFNHDYVTYTANEEALYARYEENKDRVVSELKKMLDCAEGLTGQWSIDVMQNGEDFYLIDAAVAEASAFYQNTVPIEKRRPREENWLPDFGGMENSIESDLETVDR